MLRRIADQLFWAARYLERAQWRARLVDVNYNLLLEVPPRDIDAWEPLLAITGEAESFNAHHNQADERTVVNFFALDPANPASIRSCIEAARTNLRSIRHQISSELWLEVNRLHLDAANWPADAFALGALNAFFATLRERFYTISGVVWNTMTRDIAYDFFELGTMLECADNVARLLDVKYHYLLPRLEDVGGAADIRQWAALLRSASSLEAFRRIYGNALRVDRVVDLLLFNGAIPRSARYCADRIAAALARIAALDSDGSAPQLGQERLIGWLADSSADIAITGGLHEFLLGFQSECAALATRIAAAYMPED
ncbi:MAG TPA: alpha-E domain-containing protein [Candidatus Binataceae bacterium]|nr:alpha-E domain-containing protein [Candidatus Binataceae bacterium]